MSTKPQDFSFDAIAVALSKEFEQNVASAAISPLENSTFNTGADATSKFLVPISGTQKGVLIASGRGNLDLVARAVQNIELVRKETSARVANHVLMPEASGKILGHSFAVWPLHISFDDVTRVGRFFRRRRYERHIIRWTEELSLETLRPSDPKTILQDLDAILNNKNLPDEMHKDTQVALEQIYSGLWKPQHCIDHNDFWSGNILLPKSNQKKIAFFVIDWAGMRQKGYPFWDMIRMLISLRSSRSFSRKSILNLQQKMGCREQDALHYTLCSLGNIGRNLEYFPANLYQDMALQCYQFIKSIR